MRRVVTNRLSAVLSVLWLAIAVVMGGCSQNKSTKGDDVEEPTAPPVFKLKVELDKKSYRVGEMVCATIEVVNQTQDDLVIVPLMARRLKSQSNVNFYFGAVGVMDVRRVVPVLPAKEDIRKFGTPQPEPIAGEGRLAPKKFFFTTMTSEPGEYQLQVHFTSSLHVRIPGRNICYSDPVRFKVKDKMAYRRDRDGYILEEEAIRVAKEHYGKVARDAYAVLVKNDKGLWDWWVTLEKMPADVRPGEDALEAYYISPYGGFIRETGVRPFRKPESEEPEIRKAPRGSKLHKPGGVVIKR